MRTTGSATAEPPPAQPRKLKRSMGLWMATALVVGNMIGSGVFLLPASLADTAGPVSMVGWAFTGAGAILLALVFASLGRALPRTGGPYAYAKRAFGDFIGFQTAWGYWIAVWAGNAAIAVAFVGYHAVFWPAAGTDKLLGALVGIALIWLLLLQAAARNRSLRAVVSEGAGVRSLAEHLHTPGLGPVQRWFSNWIVQNAALAVLGDAAPPDDLTDLVGRISPRRVLLIQAEQGAGGEELNPVYADAAGATARLWRGRGTHTGALAALPAEYERRVIAF